MRDRGLGARPLGVAAGLQLPSGVFALLAIFAVALVVGKLACRITVSIELILLLLVTAIVLVEFLSWSQQEATGPAETIWWLLSRGR